MSKPPTNHGLPEDAQRLHLELTAAAEQQRSPCRGRDEWTSEDAADRAAALEACSHCPLQAPCAAYARAADERHGVWAGLDRSDPNARRRQKRGVA